MGRHLPFKFEPSYFPITLDPTDSLDDLFREFLVHISSREKIKLKRPSPPSDHGPKEIFLRYAILREDMTLQDVQSIAKGNNIILTGAKGFFTFANKHIHTEVTREKPTPIVVADNKSTWFSRQTLSIAAMGLKWSQSPYATGPHLYPASGLVKKGARVLMDCR